MTAPPGPTGSKGSIDCISEQRGPVLWDPRLRQNRPWPSEDPWPVWSKRQIRDSQNGKGARRAACASRRTAFRHALWREDRQQR